MELTSEQLVKIILTEETCELYDRLRINNLLKNVDKGFGKVIISETTVTITISVTKTKKFNYIVPKELLPTKQLLT
jgi:hypothetical protein